MAQAEISRYGSWRSPITSELIVKEQVGLGQVQLDSSYIYWIEMRPAEGGRQVIVRHSPDGANVDVTPRPFNARTRVHEYGGGDYVAQNATVYFSNFDDQQLYRQRGVLSPEKSGPFGSESQNAAPVRVTPESGGGGMRFADAIVDKNRERLICV